MKTATTGKFAHFGFFANPNLNREGLGSPDASELEALLAMEAPLRYEEARKWISRNIDGPSAPRVFVDAGFLGGRELRKALAQFTQDLLMVLPDALTVTLLADE